MPSTARQPRGEATRSDIIHVARRLFSEHGYHATGLSDIQTATGLTKGAFYHHFRSKEDLALAVLETAREEYDRYWLGPAMQHDSPGKRVVALLDSLLELNARPEWCNCQMMATLCSELTNVDPRLHAAVRDMQCEMIKTWQDALAQARETGEIAPAMEPAVMAQLIVSTLLGLLMSRKLGSLQVLPAQIVNGIKSVLFAGTTQAG